MAIQASSDFRLSVHENSVYDDTYFHVRVVASAAQIAPFIAALEAIPNNREGSYFAFTDFTAGGLNFRAEEGECVKDRLSFAFGTIDEFDGLYWTIAARGDGYVIDFSGVKEKRPIDGTAVPQLPIDFWIHPATVIRAMMGTRIH